MAYIIAEYFIHGVGEKLAATRKTRDAVPLFNNVILRSIISVSERNLEFISNSSITAHKCAK